MAAALIAALVLATPVAAVAPVRSNADSTRTSTTDRAYALVQLKLAPLATASASKPAPGKKIDFNRSETKNYRSQLSAQRNEFKAWLRTNLPNARVTGEYDIALNGFGVKLSGHTLAQLMTSPLVVRAEYQNSTTHSLMAIRTSRSSMRSRHGTEPVGRQVPAEASRSPSSTAASIRHIRASVTPDILPNLKSAFGSSPTTR